MEIENVKSEIDGLERSKKKSILQNLHGQIIKKDSFIREFHNRLSELETRVTVGEKYSSKESLIFKKMSVKDPEQPLPHHVCDFINYYLLY